MIPILEGDFPILGYKIIAILELCLPMLDCIDDTNIGSRFPNIGLLNNTNIGIVITNVGLYR